MNAFENFICTEPADRKRAEAAILKYRGDISKIKRGRFLPNPKPQFIWCASPQTAVVMVKLLSDMHEGENPVLSIAHTPEGTETNRVGSPSPFSLRQIYAAINFNPIINLFEGYPEENNLTEIALNNTQPYLSDIKLDPALKGSRLKLRKAYYGQHDLHADSTLRTELAQSCGWVWDYGSFVFLCERQYVLHYRIQEERIETIILHNVEGPAIAWLDGFKIYSINGITVPDFVVEKPRLITLYKINHDRNQEIRRILIDRYKLGEKVQGLAAYIIDSGAVIIDHDEQWGTLYTLFNTPVGEEETIRMIEVVNRSPELDGSFKHYFLRVPPDINSSHEASAWTFGFEPSEYLPLKET